MPFVVESQIGGEGVHTATARVYVATEQRAREIVEQGAANGAVRTWRPIALADMPAAARENLERAARE